MRDFKFLFHPIYSPFYYEYGVYFCIKCPLMTAVFEKAYIFQNLSVKTFEEMAVHLFKYQYRHMAIYQQYCDHIGIDPNTVKTLCDIPCIPISFFKTHKVYNHELGNPQIVFSSSGTTGQQRSKHHVYDLEIYKMSFQKGFEIFYGDTSYAILALLPSYSRGQSSLIYMVDSLIHSSEYTESQYYTDNFKALRAAILSLNERQIPTILIGVSHALLDLINDGTIYAPRLVVMETGGMKGRRKEIVREELHGILCDGLGVSEVHSEYGMTELLSQAYARKKGLFECPPWMKVLPRSTEDPLSLGEYDRTAGINIIDLANMYSCAFIATEDLGIVRSDGVFEILGRFQDSDVRGCNLMYAP